MKILYVTALNETINAFLIPHIKILIEQGHKVDCACNINEEIDSSLIDLGVNYFNIKFARNPLKINYIKVISDIKKIYFQNKYDVVHVHTPIASFLTRFALRKEKVQIIYTSHGFHFFKGAPLINWLVYYPLERVAANWTDKIVTINNEDYERAKTFKLRDNGKVELMHGVGINPDDYKVVNLDIKAYRESLGLKQNDFMILILADINKNKNHIQVIKAMNKLKNEYPNIKVICAGEGPLKNKLIKKVSELGLEDNIKFLGFRRDVKELINCSQCIGLFSMREGLPKSLMEAICCGKPVITSNIRGCKEFGGDKEIGQLVNPKDYISISNGIESVIKNKFNSIEIKEKVDVYEISRVLDEVVEIHNIL